MRRLIVGIAAILVLVGIIYVALFKREAVMSLFSQGTLAVQGYTPAKTPSEAMDSFKKALKERNYGAAEVYLGGEYLEQFHKGSKNGQALGLAIDRLLDAMQTTGTKSDKVKYVLRLMDPFPGNLQVLDVKPSADGKTATAVFQEESGSALDISSPLQDWHVDNRMLRSLARPVLAANAMVNATVELRKEGDGDKAQWKIFLPVTPELRLCVDYLAENGSNYAVAVTRVKEDLKNDATTKESLENALKTALAESK